MINIFCSLTSYRTRKSIVIIDYYLHQNSFSGPNFTTVAFFSDAFLIYGWKSTQKREANKLNEKEKEKSALATSHCTDETPSSGRCLTGGTCHFT